jgi:hypothetical protein
MVVRRHNDGHKELQVVFFNFVDSVYRHALFIASACYENNIGQSSAWLCLPEKEFLSYFRENVPEEGKEFLREMFREKPALKIKDHENLILFTAITNYFYEIFGLGDSPEWANKHKLKAARIYDGAILTNRPIRWAMEDPKSRQRHLATLGATRNAVDQGALEILARGDYAGVGHLILEELGKSHGRMKKNVSIEGCVPH